MENKASVSALMCAFVRAYHTETSDNPVFPDKIAGKFFTDEEYDQMKEYIVSGADFFKPGIKESAASREEILDFIVNTQLAPTPVARARYCEDCLKSAVLTGTQQYVILGAGFDTFAWREESLTKKLTVFEADHPLTQSEKCKRLSRAGLEIPSGLHFVPMDFAKDNLKEKLVASGFDVTKKTFFSWLGVSYYLTDEQIRSMLRDISSFAAEGSTIVFDYPDENLFNSEISRVKNMTAMAAAGGEPMKFCCDSIYLAKMLEEQNFLIYEELSPDDIDSQILGDSDITAFEHINYVTAVIKNTGQINTKEKILQTALQLFARRGFNAVSVRDISDKLGISPAALYRHYKNKQDIFEHIFYRMEEKIVFPDNSEIAGIREYAVSFFRLMTEDSFSSSFRKMLTLEQYRSNEMTQKYKEYLTEGPIEKIAGILSEKKCSNPKETALNFYSPLFMLMSLYDSSDNRTEITRIAEKHIACFEFE